jgi:hypothetical protein
MAAPPAAAGGLGVDNDMASIPFAAPRIDRLTWERRMVKPTTGEGTSFNDMILGSSTASYLLLRVLYHDKPHVVTMLASRVREDKTSGCMLQGLGDYCVVKVREGEGREKRTRRGFAKTRRGFAKSAWRH